MRLTRLGAVLLGLLLALVAVDVAVWGFGLADQVPPQVEYTLVIVNAVCIGTIAMFITGATPFSMRMARSGRALPTSEAETVEKWTE